MDEPKDKITVTRAIEVIENMAESAWMESQDDPEDLDMAEKAEALNLATQALHDVLEKQGGKD